MDQPPPPRTLREKVARTIRKEILPMIPSCILGALLLAIWVASMMQDPHEGSLFLHIFAVLAWLAVIFFADALEVAYSLLRHKDIDQFGETTGSILKQMHDKEDAVYEGREWLVTAMIVFITVIVEFDQIYLPFPNPLKGDWHRVIPIPLYFRWIPIRTTTIFSIFFTTFPILWLAQGPSKKIARRFPQRMVDAGSLIWLFVIRPVGWLTDFLKLNKPTELGARLWERIAGLKDDGSLRPSDLHYFLVSVQRYGYAQHDIQMRVSVAGDGSATIEQRLVYYVIDRPCNIFERRLAFSKAEPCAFEQVTAKAYRMDVIGEIGFPEETSKILETLDLIADKTKAGLPCITCLEEIPAVINVVPVADEKDPSVHPASDEKNPDPMRYRIPPAVTAEAPAPGHDPVSLEGGNEMNLMHYRIDTRGTIPSNEKAFALLVEFKSTWGAGAFDMEERGSDFFYMYIDCPCKRYSLTVDTTADCLLRPGEVDAEAICGSDPHWGERDRLQRSLSLDADSPNGIHCDLPYPFPGTKYQLGWKWTNKTTKNNENSPCRPLANPANGAQAVTPPPPPQSAHGVPPPPPK